METCMATKSTNQCWLYKKKCTNRKRSFLDRGTAVTPPTPVTCRHPFYYNVDRHQASEKRIYWVESTYISSPIQNSTSSIKIKFKSCCNGQYNMEPKKRSRKSGFKNKQCSNANTEGAGVVEPFIDKFSLIKARRHKSEQFYDRRKIFKTKNPFKEKEKLPTSEAVESVVDERPVKQEAKDSAKAMDNEHLTINLKRVGIDINGDRIEEKLSSDSSLSHLFRKRPNISLERMNRKDLKALSKDGFIKTENCDQTNKENKPDRAEDSRRETTPTKSMMITPEHLNKLKSKLKKVSYKRIKQKGRSFNSKPAEDHVPNEKTLSRDEAPNILDDNPIATSLDCPESPQPPVLIPELSRCEDDVYSCDEDTPFVYLETKPDVEELKRQIQHFEPSENTLDKKSFSEKTVDTLENSIAKSDCQHLEVFVCKQSLEDSSRDEIDSIDKLDFMLARQTQNETNQSDGYSEDVNSGSESVCLSGENSPSQIQKISISEIQVPKALSTCSVDHCSSSSKETTIDHSVSHSLKDISSQSDALHIQEVTPIESAAEVQTIDTENGLTSMSCEKLSINHGDSNNASSPPRNAADVIDNTPLDTEINTVFPHRNNNVSELSHSIPSLANGNPTYTEASTRFVAREPNEAACVNGYDSDATFVYDEDDDARDVAMCDKLVKNNRHSQRFSMHPQSHSKLKIRDSVEVKCLKKSVFKKVNSRKAGAKHSKAKTDKSEEGLDVSEKKLKVKINNPRQRRQTVNKESNSKDLTLTISPRKKNKKKANNNLNGVIKLHDVFHFEDSNEGKEVNMKKVLPPKNDSKHLTNEKPERNDGMKNKKVPQSRHKAKTRHSRRRIKNKACSALDSIDEDDLPKILPPKRRRNAKTNTAMKTTTAVVTNDMERLIQEFPNHNWLENKYKSEDRARVGPDETKPSQEVYEYSLDDEKMESIERTEDDHSAGDVNYSVVNTNSEQPGCTQQNTLTPGAPPVTSDNAESCDEADRDRLQIVTDVEQDDQPMEVMIPCTLPATVAEDTSVNPEINRENQDSNTAIETSEAGEESVPPVVLPEEVTENTRATTNPLPPVPQLIKVSESNQSESNHSALPTYEMVESSNTESCEAVTVNQTLSENVCTPVMASDSATITSCSSPISTVTVTSNKRCIASTKTSEDHPINTRKRRLLSSDESDDRNRFYGEASLADSVREKSSNTQCPEVDINNLKEIITAKVKSDINNQLQRTLKEFRELDQLVSEKAREAEALRQMREQKLKDLQMIQQNNSEAEIKRILNEKLSMVEKQAELKSDMSSPPPAHQRPKQNIRELLDKMDQSHSQTPIDCSTFSAFSARKTPLHSPNTNVDGKNSTSAHCHVTPGRIDVSKTETGNIPAHVTPLHEAEQRCALRASSAPVLCNNKNSFNRQASSSDTRQTIANRAHPVSSTVRSFNGAKSSAGTIKQNDAFIDLSRGSADSEVEIQRELHRALAAKRQKHDPSVKQDTYKNKEGQVSRVHHQNGEPSVTRQNIQPPNAQTIINAKSKDPRGFAQYSQNPYPQQIVRPVSYPNMVNPSNSPMDRAAASHQSNSGMMRPHSIRLLGATALGNVHHPMEGRQAYTYASNIPLNTFQNTGSIQHGTPIRQIPGITNPAHPHVRPSLANGVQTLENGQLLRHIPITAARTIDDPQKASYVQQATISSMGQPIIRPQGNLRPLAPANSTRSQAADPAIGHSMKRMPNNTTVHVIPSQQQQQQSNIHTNMNGKCIVCSKFALYLCSNCQQFWYCSPQCQLKHWVTHQHNCKIQTVNTIT